MNMASTCFNCLMLRSIPKISGRAEIRKRQMFYNSHSSSSIFPRNHILNTLRPNNSSAHTLLQHIFNLCGEGLDTYHKFCWHEKNHCPPSSGCMYHSLLKILKTLIRNSRKCQYKKLLCKHCPILNFLGRKDNTSHISEATEKKKKKKKRNGKTFPGLDRISEDPHLELPHAKKKVKNEKQADPESSKRKPYCEQKEVVSFVWAATRSIVPADLLGDHSNWRSLRVNISKFVGLRMFENFSLRQCVDRLQTSKFPFLSKNPNRPLCNNLKHKIFHSWIYWFFSHMIVPILGANFYVTESEFGKHEALYYPKPVWSNMLSRALTSLKQLSYKPVDFKYFSKVTESRSFGFSRARFLPKENGMRLLANLKAPSKAWFDLKGRGKLVCFRSVNSALHDVHAILKRIKVDHPEMMGASVFDYNDVYHVLHGFLSKLKNGSSTMPPVFIVVADVSKAFDSIDQDRLLGIMKDVALKDEYLLRRYAHVICTKKTMSTRYGYVCVDHNESHDIAKALTSVRSGSSHGVITDQGILKRVNRAEIHHLLREHVKRNILRLGDEFCVQKSGISQGSLLSSLLCSFYYGHMERRVVLPFLGKIPASADVTHYTLLRLVDDFLFISTSEEQASGFFDRLRRGFREYNCYMNGEKFGLNFDLDGQRQPKSNRRHVGADGIPFLPWSGLLINCLTLEIQADYTRYMGTHMRSTLTVQAHSKVEERLGEKLCNYMRPKCHPLFYDSNINSSRTVCLNVYQAFLLCAMKFHSYLRALPSRSALTPSRSFSLICKSFSYMHRLIKKRMYGGGRRKGDVAPPVLRLKKAETVWLGLSAYVRVLRKKQARHGELLVLLGSALEERHIPLGCDTSPLDYAVDDSHSSLFWQIKY